MSESITTHAKTGAHKLPARWLYAILIIACVASFALGAYKDTIISFGGSLLGIPQYTEQINTASLQDTYQKLKANFDGELSDEALIQGANKGLVEAAGDEYTTYLTAEESDEFNDSLSGSIGGGIGAEIGLRDELVSVVRVLTGTPAEKAGLKTGDIITHINGEETSGWTTTEAVEKIRGEVGTTVKLTIIRGDDKKEMSITREEITTPSVESEVRGDVGIITMTRFDQDTGGLARQAAQSFEREGIKKVVLDLRSNGGGYLTAAQSVAGLWLNDKVVVTERRGDEVVEELRSGGSPLLEGVKTVVLVDQYSASASEIVAGALKEHGVATLVGMQTYGKGSVQQLITLSSGAQLKVTVAKWYTPNGQNISKEGIAPDEVVEPTDEDLSSGNDVQLKKALELLNE